MDILIIEDELLAVKNLKTVLDEIGGINVVATLESIARSDRNTRIFFICLFTPPL